VSDNFSDFFIPFFSNPQKRCPSFCETKVFFFPNDALRFRKCPRTFFRGKVSAFFSKAVEKVARSAKVGAFFGHFLRNKEKK